MVTGDGRQAPQDAVLAEDGDLAGRLALAVGRLNRRMRSSTGGLSHGQLSALSTIVRNGPLRPSEISAIEVVAAPTITRVVSDLEARGLITRQPDPDDGRSFFVTGTDAGIELLVRARFDRARTLSALTALEAAAHVASPGESGESGESGEPGEPGEPGESDRTS
jgi:DNA-binding MarR family transcriptional regulator